MKLRLLLKIVLVGVVLFILLLSLFEAEVLSRCVEMCKIRDGENMEEHMLEEQEQETTPEYYYEI